MTNELKALVKSMLYTITEQTYNRKAPNDAMYPHIVFELATHDNLDLSRRDPVIEIHLWDKSEDTSTLDEMADNIESLFQDANEPTEDILPTFYLMDRRQVEDEDKKIYHILVRVIAQTYERS